MWELATLQRPFHDMLFDETGKRIATWQHIAALTHKNNLRPTLPDEMDNVLRELVEECWSPHPQMRPSFEAISFRARVLDTTMMQANFGRSKSNLLQPRSDRSQSDALLGICRGVNALLWAVAGVNATPGTDSLVTEDASASATDPILNAMLEGSTGLACIEALARLLLHGYGEAKDDAPVAVPEPLLDDHITVDEKRSQCLLSLRYTLEARASSALVLRSRSSQEVALIKNVELTMFAPRKKTSSGRRLGFGRKVTKGPSRRDTASERKRKRMFEKWVKATRFVQGRGRNKLHPGECERAFPSTLTRLASSSFPASPRPTFTLTLRDHATPLSSCKDQTLRAGTTGPRR